MQPAQKVVQQQNGEAAGDITAKEAAWWVPAMKIFFRTTAWIAFPVIVALYIGSWLEARYGEKSHLMFVSVALAFVATIGGLIKITLGEFHNLYKGQKEVPSRPPRPDDDKVHAEIEKAKNKLKFFR